MSSGALTCAARPVRGRQPFQPMTCLLSMPAQDPSSPALLLLDLLSDPKLQHGTALAALTPEARAQMSRLARGQRVLAPLVLALEDAALGVPDELRFDRRAALARALTIQAEALRVHQILARAGIAHRFLKGVVLAAGVYPTPWGRPMRDIDILLRPDDLLRAHALVAAEGGVMDGQAHKPVAQTDLDAKHLPPLWSPQRVIGIELHSHAIGPDCGLAAPARAALDAALWQGEHKARCGGLALPCPGPEAMLAHLVVHALHDHELNNGPVLISDLRHLLARTPPDPAKLGALVSALGIERALSLALSLLSERQVALAGLETALQKGVSLSPDIAMALLFQDPGQRNELRLAADIAQAGAGGRVRLLLQRALPGRRTALDRWYMEQGGTDTPPPVAPLLWLWFLRMRWQQMRARAGKVAGVDPRDHLLHLRDLRDRAR